MNFINLISIGFLFLFLQVDTEVRIFEIESLSPNKENSCNVKSVHLETKRIEKNADFYFGL